VQEAASPSSPRRASRLTSDLDPRLEPEVVWDDEERWALIAENAYYRAERRGFLPGFELEDWLAAEQEIIERIRASGGT
jgi:Protein of unknown function (DUF2934)